MKHITSIANGIDGANERVGHLTCYLTVIMVAAGSFNAIVRWLSNLARIDPGADGLLDPLLRFVGETALAVNSNVFIELQWYLFSLVFLLGAAWTFRHDVHVRVDVIYARLSRRKKAWINIWGTALFLLPFCALIVWTSWPVVVDSWARLEGSPDPGGLPRYPLLTIIPLAFLLLMLQGLAILLREVAVLRGISTDGAASE